MTNRRRGSALLVVMILAIGLAAAGMALLPAVTAADAASQEDARWVRAGHIAEAGLEHVFALMREGEDVSGNNLLALGDGSAYIRVDALPGAAKDVFVVESTANVSDRPDAMRTVRAVVRREGKRVSVLRWERP